GDSGPDRVKQLPVVSSRFSVLSSQFSVGSPFSESPGFSLIGLSEGSPGGATELSPALQRWEKRKK
ncbi:MAG: hypothetical protein WAO35_12930, partial [Terriglobia bacterium]